MYKKSLVFAGVCSLFLFQTAQAADENWIVDPVHSDAHFSIRHMMISNVSGDFAKISGTARYDGVNLNKASVIATIPVESIDTRESRRDDHLKSPEFFDLAKYPTISFQSKKIETLPNGEFQMTGDLTLHGITKEVALKGPLPSKPIKDPYGKTRIGATASTQINRKDFGLTFDKTLDNGGAVVGDDVAVTLNVELVNATPAPQRKLGAL
jgi:polyisoprenoid-binding protein YceI